MKSKTINGDIYNIDKPYTVKWIFTQLHNCEIFLEYVDNRVILLVTIFSNVSYDS
jgi:hypothetical protein